MNSAAEAQADLSLRFSTAFGVHAARGELDFVDIPLERDIPLFVDPFALSQRVDRWSVDAHRTLVSFFQAIVDAIRSGNDDYARQLLSRLKEPNETRFGFSADKPQGAGIGTSQANDLFRALADSSAVKTGFLSSLAECELMVDGIGRDKLSDLTTNVIRGHLAAYTRSQCDLWSISAQRVALAPWWDTHRNAWVSEYVDLPVWSGAPILLVPKSISRWDPAYDHRRYYRHLVLEHLQAEHLSAGSSLVHTLKNGSQRVYKKDLETQYPCTKEFLYNFSRDNPSVLQTYRENLEAKEKAATWAELAEPEDEGAIAEHLAAALRAIPTGNDAATAYHRLMIGVLEFLFFPHLLHPVKEQEIHDGRKRIDITMENGARGGYFWNLHSVKKLPCAYVPIECKNYGREVSNPELDQLAGRFSPNRGKFGMLCCRRFENAALFLARCRDTLKDDRGLILPLDDDTVLRWLGLVRDGTRAKVNDELADLTRMIWLS